MCNSFRAALYLRLSKDDGNDESQSITNQRDMLTAFANERDYFIVDYYIDDGYSGTNFDRPDFKRMIEDIKRGEINTVITKDLSRFGRNYIHTGYYLEEFFPENNVRYIAINDNYDSANDFGNDFGPFKNVINEWYAKDVSRKIRGVLDSKAKRGEPRNTVFPIFGYNYNTAFERVPDAETAPIVKTIYQKFVECGSASQVAKYLTERKIKTPRYYNAVKHNYNTKKVLAMDEIALTTWTPDGIRDIISKEEYLGVYKTAQSVSVSYKNKKRHDNKNAYIFENKYPPLIDRQTWEIANKIIKNSRSGKLPVIENVYKGLIICADCGKPMNIERRNKEKGKFDYRYHCGKPYCKFTNSITRTELETLIKDELFKLKSVVLKNKQEFLDFAENFSVDGRTVKSNVETELNKALQKNSEIDGYIEKLFEENVKGIIPNSTFKLLLEKYKKEKKAYEDEIEELEKRLRRDKENCQYSIKSKTLVEQLENTDFTKEFDFVLVHKFIKSISVKTEYTTKSRKYKKIHIEFRYFKCDGIIKEFKEREG